ncbi:coiled-coil and C2 domain-containing protein 1-like isoform X2 [Sitophilus oryzae]|uniref:Coiled-coil and C2 domain-containing protein 1-like isoform X2 n=1 Tax=Sitophilus oryzae TaxID=7048 RepID=A0A6J2YAA5_SITOR|nr:coiled-coil and C2 domain-containing protein 1-like isoform X2 [Sitophilus oryzae]
MFSKKKPDRPNRTNPGNLAQFGLFDIPQNFDPANPMGGSVDSDGGDSDLEAELAALAGGGGAKPRKKPKQGINQLMSKQEFDAMVSVSLKDEDDAEEDVDENDPDLLSELNEITGASDEEGELTPPKEISPQKVPSGNVSEILTNRLKNYQILEREAKAAGESSKARRYGRAIKTLNDLIKKANAGVDININDESVPPEIIIKPKQPNDGTTPESEDNKTSENTDNSQGILSPTRPAPTIPIKTDPSLPDVVQNSVAEVKSGIDEELLNMLIERQKSYKIAALQAKKSGNNEQALKYVKIAKQFDLVIEAVKNGQSVDLSDMPGPPGQDDPKPRIQENETQKQSSEIEVPEIPSDIPQPELITAGTVEEALQQRLEFYKSHVQKATEEENSSKARRFGRIVKQYEQALKFHRAGKPVPFDELPTPPGFAPIPIPGTGKVTPSSPQAPKQDETAVSDSKEGGVAPAKPNASRISGNRSATSHQEKQVLILQAKQKQFKTAALNAKQKGELVQAKEFLRQAHGFDKLIEAAQAGLPVDWATIPVSPEAKSQLDDEYEIIMADEATEDGQSDNDVLSRLETQLTKQLKMCLSTRDHHKALGDVAGTNRFERLALNVTKDLDVIRVSRRTNNRVPKFHYETKDFAIVKSFTDLTDNDLELFIVRGINYKSENPKDIDTYVKFEFPFPQDTPYSDKTSTIKDTNNPTYDQTFVIPIQRSSRQCQRVFKRHGIKFEVYSRGGFFRSDSLIGTVNLKLQPLETQCEIHDSFDVMDGRRKTGGKLEVRLRLRSPIVTQQVEQIQEKWLIIDQ